MSDRYPDLLVVETLEPGEMLEIIGGAGADDPPGDDSATGIDDHTNNGDSGRGKKTRRRRRKNKYKHLNDDGPNHT